MRIWSSWTFDNPPHLVQVVIECPLGPLNRVNLFMKYAVLFAQQFQIINSGQSEILFQIPRVSVHPSVIPSVQKIVSFFSLQRYVLSLPQRG